MVELMSIPFHHKMVSNIKAEKQLTQQDETNFQGGKHVEMEMGIFPPVVCILVSIGFTGFIQAETGLNKAINTRR